MATVLISSWSDGVFALSPHGHTHELKGRRVSGLASDGGPGALAIVDGTVLARRSPGESWSEIAASEVPLTCCLAVGDAVYVGTEGAHLLRTWDGAKDGTREESRDGPPLELERVASFDAIEGRATWFAGSALVDGRRVGPPLEVRSLAGSSDGRVLLAAVHVGGIPRSVDGGLTWHPTLDVDWDVHEVRVHPDDPRLAIAACAVGLAVSDDGGAHWTLDPLGREVVKLTQATHCSAVAFAGDAPLVSVSEGPFAAHGTVLRRPLAEPASSRPAGGGLPDRLEGIVDTGCIASKGTHLAVVDRGGNVYVSRDGGGRWTRRVSELRDPSGALVV